MNTSAPFDPRRGRWIPYVFVGLMLLVVVVNGGMVIAALTTFAGTTTGRSYDRGRAYNQVIEEAARQAALGWSARVALTQGRLSVTVTDREGLAVPGHLEGVLLRPLEGTQLPLSLASTAPGQWAADPGALAPGQWEARLTLTGANGAHLDIRQRVLAP